MRFESEEEGGGAFLHSKFCTPVNIFGLLCSIKKKLCRIA